MKTKHLVVYGAIAAILLAVAVEAGSQMRGARADRGPGAGPAWQKLGLTPEQQEKMQAQHLKRAKAMVQLQADLKVAQLDLRALMGEDEVNRAAVKAKVADVNRAQGKVLEARVDHQISVSQILTPEQRKKMQAMGKRMQAGRKMGRHDRGWQGQSRRGPGQMGRGMRRGGGRWGMPGPQAAPAPEPGDQE